MLGVVDWNMKLLYVLPGWEGSASDSRVLRDSTRTDRQDAFVVPHGRYYLADVGYTNGPGFLAPFRSTRYHLKEWASSQQQPQNAKELYNLRHSRARNVVERTFGLWKKKWGILRTQSFFDIKDQVTCVHWFFNKMHNIVKNSYVKRTLLQIRIINACCMLHNFARDRQH
uniref:DDE Tnp4 domain-containing protein n=1 Tax=Aegilops tauschii subsp. strangulata TaxID=200361 RepID=A0A453N9A2_AEGTS